MSFDKNGPFKLNITTLLSILSLLVFVYCIPNPETQQTLHSEAGKKPGKKNIIMMVTDGTGPSSFNMARSFNQYIKDLSFDEPLFIDKYLIGQSRTRSSSSLITDSAAGATAFSCALKSYNGAIGVDQFKNPCGTILEALKLKGWKTGLVVTTSITDATPAAFSSHADYRQFQDLIANQQLGLNMTITGPDGNGLVDLMIGGGRCSFLPGSSVEGCRQDELNLIEYALERGWNVSLTREEFDQLGMGLNEEVSLPVLSLLAYYNIPYELDRNEHKFPSLFEETVTALNILSRETAESDQGFFLLVEGSRIDHAGHHNDPHAQVHEILAFDKAFQAVIEFAENSDVETYVISTSDHETGGVDVGRQVTPEYPDYIWYPEVLDRARHSGEFLNFKINKWMHERGTIKQEELREYIEREILEKDLGILDYDRDEIHDILELIYRDSASNETDEGYITITEVDGASAVVEFLKDMVSRRARIGWSTHGHTAADVNVYGYCNREQGEHLLVTALGGNIENIQIGKFMEQIGGVELSELSDKLVREGQIHAPA
ncbi:unnamed protein product [Pichia kudriavzevii]